MEQQEISEKVCLFAGYVCVTGIQNGFPVELQITDVQQDNTSKKTTGDARISCGTYRSKEYKINLKTCIIVILVKAHSNVLH